MKPGHACRQRLVLRLDFRLLARFVVAGCAFCTLAPLLQSGFQHELQHECGQESACMTETVTWQILLCMLHMNFASYHMNCTPQKDYTVLGCGRSVDWRSACRPTEKMRSDPLLMCQNTCHIPTPSMMFEVVCFGLEQGVSCCSWACTWCMMSLTTQPKRKSTRWVARKRSCWFTVREPPVPTPLATPPSLTGQSPAPPHSSDLQ